MAKPGASARRKGANFERELAHLLSDLTGKMWVRGLNQTRGGGAETSDVICTTHPHIHIEAKNQKRCNIKGAMEQAEEDIKKANKTATPIVITKDTGSDILVTMKFDDWIKYFIAGEGLATEFATEVS